MVGIAVRHAPTSPVLLTSTVAYSLHFDRQLGRASLSAQAHIYPKACPVHLQEQNREIFSTLEYLIHGSVFLGKLV